MGVSVPPPLPLLTLPSQHRRIGTLPSRRRVPLGLRLVFIRHGLLQHHLGPRLPLQVKGHPLDLRLQERTLQTSPVIWPRLQEPRECPGLHLCKPTSRTSIHRRFGCIGRIKQERNGVRLWQAGREEGQSQWLQHLCPDIHPAQVRTSIP